MEKEIFDDWLKKLGKAWSDRNPEKTANLFSKDVEYHESVFNPPCKNWEEVLNENIKILKLKQCTEHVKYITHYNSRHFTSIRCKPGAPSHVFNLVNKYHSGN